MSLIDVNTLAGTLGNINDALLRGEKFSLADRNQAAAWITERAGAPGSYCGLPAPTGRDYGTKLRLYTGEIVGSHAGTGCKLGFEAAWALTVLAPTRAAPAKAAERCRERVIERFAQETARRRGMYCCYSCSVAGWRALGVFREAQAGELLGAALSLLKSLRDGRGRWEKFPFWYTVLALHDLDRPDALAELRHAAGALKRPLRGKENPDPVCRRRRLLAEWVLAKA